MQKAEFIRHWHGIEANRPIRPRPVPYKHEGSTYEMDGIRVTGSADFVDSVLSRLKDLIACENGRTRLQVSYQPTKERETGLPSALDSVNCYIQVHRRGPQSQSSCRNRLVLA